MNGDDGMNGSNDLTQQKHHDGDEHVEAETPNQIGIGKLHEFQLVLGFGEDLHDTPFFQEQRAHGETESKCTEPDTGATDGVAWTLKNPKEQRDGADETTELQYYVGPSAMG